MGITQSGLPIDPVYGPASRDGWDPKVELGEPGEFPFTRGVYPSMYTGRPWTMRQYAGFGTAAESNERYHQLLAAGTTGLSVAFDLPTQMGYDSDHQLAQGEVGKVGVAIDTVEDMKILFDRIPLDQVSTSMTINSPASTLLLMYQLVAEGEGIPGTALNGTIQNDVLKEYISRGTYIYPPAASLRLTTDIFDYCAKEIPRWNTISISGYHMGEAGATPAQEIAFTLSNGIEYVRAAIKAGMNVDDFAPRLAFFFVSRTTILEEIAKFRAARRIWARIMKDEFKATNPKSQMLRFHTQTAGVQLTAQQPEVNLVRVAIQGLAAVLGGTQSLHTNSFDEAIALPTEKAARLALRTHETSAYDYALQIDKGERTVVGVNKFAIDVEEKYEPLRVDPAIGEQQVARLQAIRDSRNNSDVTRALDSLKRAAESTENVMYPMKEALAAKASGGEVADALREVWGRYNPPDIF